MILSLNLSSRSSKKFLRLMTPSKYKQNILMKVVQSVSVLSYFYKLMKVCSSGLARSAKSSGYLAYISLEMDFM